MRFLTYFFRTSGINTEIEIPINEKYFIIEYYLSFYSKINSQIKASWRRWPILILWLLYATNSAFQFLEFTSIIEAIVQFYHVTEDQVLWMSGMF